MDTKELQDQIKSVSARLNWKIPKLAEILFVATNDEQCDEEVEVKLFYEKLKGQLKRNKTSPELLNNYLNIITNHPDYIKSDIVVPKYITTDKISQSLRDAIEITSEDITQRVVKNDL